MKNSRNKLAILFFLFSLASYAQVGIGTPAPASTLDVTAANLTGTTVDGLLIPRVSRLRAQSMTGTPTSTMLYINDITNGTATGTTVNVTTTGFYFFNGTTWEKLGSGATNAWNVTGNAGLSGTVNFVGTTDNVDLAFRRSNVASGKIGAASTSFGVNALNAGAATNNAAFGTNALVLSTGTDNVAVGNGALSANTTGVQNTGIGNAALAANRGNASTAVGFQALASNTVANNNTGVGFQALTNNTTGGSNTALGFQASATNSTGGQNTSVGFQSLFFNTTGGNNTAVGRHALHRTLGSNNTAVGQQALLNNDSGSANTAVGSDAMRINTGTGNTAMGWTAGEEHGAGSYNTYFGTEAGRYNTGTAQNNAFFGYRSGHRSTGSQNTVLGANTLTGAGASGNNVIVGYGAIAGGTTASNNTAVGVGALTTNMTGTGNVAIGYAAGGLETGSDKLYIENSNANESNALIYGEFNNNILRVNGTLQINNPTTTIGYALPNVRGTAGQILQTNGAGATSWVTNPATSLSLVRANLTANQVLTTVGWQKVTFTSEQFDTGNEFTGSTYTATKPGFYRIDATIHTNDQANEQFYSVGIRVNGLFYQQSSGNHVGNGPVQRTVSCLVQLFPGNTVEVFVENYVAGAQVDSYSGKTVFEVQQVR